MITIAIVTSAMLAGIKYRIDLAKRRASLTKFGNANSAMDRREFRTVLGVDWDACARPMPTVASNTMEVNAIVRGVAGNDSSVKIDFARNRNAASAAKS